MPDNITTNVDLPGLEIKDIWSLAPLEIARTMALNAMEKAQRWPGELPKHMLEDTREASNADTLRSLWHEFITWYPQRVEDREAEAIDDADDDDDPPDPNDIAQQIHTTHSLITEASFTAAVELNLQSWIANCVPNDLQTSAARISYMRNNWDECIQCLSFDQLRIVGLSSTTMDNPAPDELERLSDECWDTNMDMAMERINNHDY